MQAEKGGGSTSISWKEPPGDPATPTAESLAGDIKVLGTVSAGRLRQASATPVRNTQTTIDHPSPAPFSSSPEVNLSIGEAMVSVQRPAETSMRSISADEAYARWQEWVGEVSRARISVGSILGESKLVEVRDGSVTIACPDDYHLASLKRNREFLMASFRSMTGYDVRIDPVLNRAAIERAPGLRSSRSDSVPQTEFEHKTTNESVENHPVVLALRRELGAEPVE
jgi:hypothetical protein